MEKDHLSLCSLRNLHSFLSSLPEARRNHGTYNSDTREKRGKKLLLPYCEDSNYSCKVTFLKQKLGTEQSELLGG